MEDVDADAEDACGSSLPAAKKCRTLSERMIQSGLVPRTAYCSTSCSSFRSLAAFALVSRYLSGAAFPPRRGELFLDGCLLPEAAMLGATLDLLFLALWAPSEEKVSNGGGLVFPLCIL